MGDFKTLPFTALMDSGILFVPAELDWRPAKDKWLSWSMCPQPVRGTGLHPHDVWKGKVFGNKVNDAPWIRAAWGRSVGEGK